jgi:hypothetical protein
MAYKAETSFTRSPEPFDAERLVAEQLAPIRESVKMK